MHKYAIILFYMLLGTTFSHKQAKWLELDCVSSFKTLLTMNFGVLRLCCYWDEIEKKEGIYDFSSIKQLLDICVEKNQKVLLTIGMKAPRWPEFYIPSWVKNREEAYVLSFIQKTVTELSSYSCITHWQVENEPLDQSGPRKRAIKQELLLREVLLVKQLDRRPILVTFWGNSGIKKKLHNAIIEHTDIVGLDLYYKQFITKQLGISVYIGPRDSDSQIDIYISQATKPIWITELQAEPWEASDLEYKSAQPKSIDPQRLRSNFERIRQMNPEAILLWGSEYWLWKAKQGDRGMMEMVRKIVSNF
jgi:hypothetical protein